MSHYSPDALTITLEAVKSCNIACTHCYCNNDLNTMMDDAELDDVIEHIHRYVSEHPFEELHFIWHGGEPLLRGVDFYRRAVRSIADRFSGQKVRHIMQTNGLLVDDAFCDLFKEHDFDIGVSIDGPADLHDELRVTKNGEGTHAAVLDKIDLLIKHGITMGFTMVVSRHCLGHAERVYEFFREIGFGFRVNPILVSPNRQATLDYMLPRLGYGQFLCDLFDAWTSTSVGRIPVSPIASYIRALQTGSSIECQHAENCVGNNMGIKPGGDVFLCTRFEDYSLGNINRNTLAEIFAGSKGQAVSARASEISICQSCKYQPACNSGCPHNAFTAFETVDVRDPYCNDYQMIFGHIRKALRPFGDEVKLTAIG